MADYDYLDKGQDDGTILGKTSSRKIGFWGTTPVDQPDALTVQLTSITHTEPSTPDYTIMDLTTTTPYGFAAKDEGNTVLKVIANLQARLAEVEARLEECGIIAAQ